LKNVNKEYIYKIEENSFLQPNTKVNEKMIAWVKENSSGFGGDFLELYCGHGNFTLPLSENFDKVLATEVSKASIRAALENVSINDIKNITFVRLSSEELSCALNGEREFRRLKDINIKKYNFKTVFVDPPRAGVDKKTLELLQRFDNIIYISCNPLTLKRDLEILTKTHKVEKFSIFDQFAYTNHMECGIILTKMI
jgi:tRNA (uracil-5-)-methyltransferase